MLIMKILGFIMVYPLLLMILGTTMVLSTESQTFVQENNILEENTSYKKETQRRKRRVTSESDWKRYFGSSEELKQDIRDLGKRQFPKRNYKPYIRH